MTLVRSGLPGALRSRERLAMPDYSKNREWVRYRGPLRVSSLSGSLDSLSSGLELTTEQQCHLASHGHVVTDDGYTISAASFEEELP